MSLLSTFVQTFLDYLKFEKRYSGHTIISYQTDLTGFTDFMELNFGEVKPTEINHNLVRSWLAYLKERDISSRTINRKISALKSFFKYHLKQGNLESTPMTQVISPKMSKRLPVFVKEEETKEMIKTFGQHTEDWKTLNAKMLVTIFYATGMRLSELINLKIKQIDSSRSVIKVLGKGNKERIIPVSTEILEMIRDYEQLKKKKIGKATLELMVTEKGKKLYPKYAYLLVKNALNETSTLDKKSPHILRHSFATHLMNHGADLNAVKELLGHTSLAATQIYTHNTIKKLKDIHKKAHPKA